MGGAAALRADDHETPDRYRLSGGSIMAKWCLSHHQENFLYHTSAKFVKSVLLMTFRCRWARPAPRFYSGRQR